MKLRFKDKEGREYPEWEEKKLGEITNKIFQNKTISKSELHKDGYPVFGANRYIGYYNKYNQEGITLTISCRGENSGNINIIYGKTWITGNSMIVDISDNFDVYYIAYFLKKIDISRYKTGGAQPQITSNIASNIKIKIPQSLEEQEKIGKLFKRIDKEIELKEEEIRLKKLKKKWLLEKIFNQELRFKDKEGKEYPEWEEKKFIDFSKINYGISPDSKNYTDNEKDIPLIQGNADIKNGYSYVSKYTIHASKIVDKGTLLFSLRAPVGFSGINNYEKAAIGRGIAGIIPIKNKQYNFVLTILKKLDQISYWEKVSQGSTFQAVSKKNFEELTINIPQSLEEQEKIGKLFKRIDKEIELKEEEIRLKKLKKKYYLQNMFN